MPFDPATPVALSHQYRKDGIYTISTATSPNLTPLTVTIKSPPPVLNVSGTGLTANLSRDRDAARHAVHGGLGRQHHHRRRPECPGPAIQPHLRRCRNLHDQAYTAARPSLSTASYTATIGQVNLNLSPDRPLINSQVVLNATGLAASAVYQLNWGDGTVESGITDQTVLTRTHGYASAQDFTVTIQNGGATLGTATVAVQVPSPVLTQQRSGPDAHPSGGQSGGGRGLHARLGRRPHRGAERHWPHRQP